MILKTFLLLVVVGLLTGLSLRTHSVAAEQNGEIISKQKTIQRTFNESNPDGKVDLKKIVDEELVRPEECEDGLVICQIKEVSFDITLKKKWLKLTIADLNAYDFANSVPLLKNSVGQLTKPETVVLQEVLAKRGLLLNLDGSIVKDRGFLGPLTWLALTRLAHIKGLKPDEQKYKERLRDEVNSLLGKMGKDANYLAQNPLPKKEQMEPKSGDPLYKVWKNYQYVSNLAQTSGKVDAGKIPLSGNIDVNVDGFVDVKRVKNQ
jgi:hypothetical protein